MEQSGPRLRGGASRLAQHLANEAEREYWLEVNAARAPSPAAAADAHAPDLLSVVLGQLAQPAL